MPLIQHSALSIDCAQHLYALLKSHKVDLASVIIDGIASVANAKALKLGLGYAGVISKVLSHFSVPRRKNEVVVSQPSAFNRSTIAKYEKSISSMSAPSSTASTSSDSRFLSSKNLSQLEELLEQHKNFVSLQVDELKQSVDEIQHKVVKVEAAVQSLLHSQMKALYQ